MKREIFVRHSVQLAVLGGVLILGAGCKKQPATTAEQAMPAQQIPAAPASSVQAPPGDSQIQADIQAKIQGEPALSGQNIQLSVSGGVATLSGRVNSEAARALAAADSASIEGVKTVVNNLEVKPESARLGRERRRQQAVAQAAPPAPPPAPAPAAPPPPAPEPVQTVAPPPPPPPPVVKTVTLPAGTTIPIRITESLNSGTTQANSIFHGSLAADLVEDGMVAARQGASVVGRVIDVHDATHFSGNSELSLELTSLDTRTQKIPLVTEAYTQQGKGRGKSTATKTGGGAALGAIIGALAGGGKGAAIGAVTGGGIGAGTNGITRGQQVNIPSETLINFRLQSAVAVTTSRPVGTSNPDGDNGPPDNGPPSELQRRQ